MADERDISRIVSALTEKPELLSAVMRIIDAGGAESDAERSAAEAAVSAADGAEPVSASAALSEGQEDFGGGRRKLLGALKPYLSEGRARAIDTMMSLSDILYMMKTR